MNLEAVDSILRQRFRKNGKDVELHWSRTPLDELMAKDDVPDLDEMTEDQLRAHADTLSVELPRKLDRAELIGIIREAHEKNWYERVTGMRGVLDYLFVDGPHPLAVVRRAYAITKAIRPQLLGGLSCADLAVLGDDGKRGTKNGRATVSARVKRVFEAPIRDAGMHGSKAPFQKSASSSQAFRRAQQGNQNRRGRDFLALQKQAAAKT